MTRRTIIIILGALIVVALMLASWFWLFSKSASVTQGLFGQDGNRTGTTTAEGTATNLPSNTTNTTSNAPSGSLTGTQNINIPLTGPGGSTGSGSVSPFNGSGSV
ncbi:MAG TPA: hypothetical protein VIY48_10055, partial [Candidatus Paceibacterota bacterium]